MNHSVSIVIASLLLNIFSAFAQHRHSTNAFQEYKSTSSLSSYFLNDNFNYDITYHKFYWKVDPAVHYITGEVSTTYTVTEDNTQSVHFELADNLQVDSIIHNDQRLDFYHNQGNLEVLLSQAYQKNEKSSLTVYYQGEPVSDQWAFRTEEHDGEPVLWTLSEPYGAKEWWPCKQTLNDKIDSIDIYIEIPKQYKAASNGLLIDTSVQENKTVWHWKHKHPIAAYLIAMAVTNYRVYNEEVKLTDGHSLTIENYVYPEAYESAKQKTRLLHPVLKYYDSLLIPYPYKDEKYGHAQCNFRGGMEHQTMTFVGLFSRSLLNHELVHHWFGDYITCGSWQDIWLNEGFATYFEGLASEKGMSSMDWESWKSHHISQATKEPNGSVYVYDTTLVGRIFNSRLSYSKGAILLHMLRWTLGDDIFFDAIRNYLNDPELADGYAKSPDLIGHFENGANRGLDEFFNDWLYGKGFPTYNVQYQQYTNNILEIKLFQEQSDPSVSFFEMKVPIMLKGASHDTLILLDHQHSGETFTLQPGFPVESIIFDPEHWILTTNPVIINLLGNQIRIYSMENAYGVFKISGINENEIKSVSVFDITGRLIENKPAEKNRFDLSHYQSGLYIIRIHTPYHSFSEKVWIY